MNRERTLKSSSLGRHNNFQRNENKQSEIPHIYFKIINNPISPAALSFHSREGFAQETQQSEKLADFLSSTDDTKAKGPFKRIFKHVEALAVTRNPNMSSRRLSLQTFTALSQPKLHMTHSPETSLLCRTSNDI